MTRDEFLKSLREMKNKMGSGSGALTTMSRDDLLKSLREMANGTSGAKVMSRDAFIESLREKRKDTQNTQNDENDIAPVVDNEEAEDTAAYDTGAVWEAINQEYGTVREGTNYAQQALTGLASYRESKQETTQSGSFWDFLLQANAKAYLTQNESPVGTAFNMNVQNYREDTSYREPTEDWDSDTEQLFGYLYGTDPEKAYAFAEQVNNLINASKKEGQTKKITEAVTENFGTGAAATAAALLTAPTAMADFADNIAEFSARGTITQKGALTPFEASQAATGGISEKLNSYGTISENIPVVGGKGLGDLYSLGYSAAQSLLAGATGGELTMLTFFGQAAASTVDEKLEAGGSAKQAMLAGLVSGAAEAAAEQIGIDNLFKNTSARTFKDVLKNMLKQGMSEGLEEGLTSVINTFADQLIMGDKSEYSTAVAEYGKTMSLEEAKKKAFWDTVEDITFDVLGGMVTGSANTAVLTSANAMKNTTQGKDALTGLTQNEQKVVDKVYEDRVAEESKDGKKVTDKRKAEIYEKVLEDMDKGYISTDTIEEVLGKDSLSKYDAISKEAEEFKTLYETEGGKLSEKQRDRLAELKAKNQEKAYKDLLVEERGKISQSVSDMVKNDRLSASYAERGRRGEQFQADLSQYNAKQRTTVQAAIDSGVLNNTNRAHEFVDFVAKVSADKGVAFDFTSNEKLKESGFALEGVTVNGFVNDSGVTVNMNSAKALNSVVGHEITHVLEGTEMYDALAQTIKEYAKAKGEYDARLEQLTRLYEGKEGYTGEDAQAKIEREVVADLVGEYLFTDKAFVQSLSTGNRNVFQKIWDEIKYLCKVVTAGSKEARQLLEVKKIFEEAYRAETKNPTGEGGVRYALSQTDIQNIQGIGRKSINNFNPQDIAATEQFAQQYWREVGAKSPFFRAWFGDWRANDSTPIQVATKQGDARGVQKNNDTGWDIQVSRKVFNETSAHKQVQNVAARKYLPYINDIVQNAVLLDSYGIDKSKSSNTLLMHSLYAVADVGNGPELLKLYVEEMNNPNSADTGKRAYQLQNIESQQLSAKGSGTSLAPSISTADIRSVADLVTAVKQHDANFTPKDASKVVNADGTPKVMYHGSPAQFTVFDKKKAKSSGLYGRGFYFTDSAVQAGVYGNQYAVYLDVKQPLQAGNTAISRDQVRGFLEAVAENEDYSIENYGTYDIDTVLDAVMGSEQTGDAFRIIQDINATAIGDMVEATELFNSINGTNFDGIIVPTETVVFRPEQIKSATDNIGTFDGNNPDIRYSLSEQNQAETDSPFPLPWQIKGGDVGLEFPLPPGYQEQSEAVNADEQGPVREDVSAGDADKNVPITTVKERLEAKQKALQTELTENQRLREQSASELDTKISKLQAEYDGKKNKDTKYANNLLRRIENLKRRKASIDADYAKRINDVESRLGKVTEQIPMDHSRQDQIDRDIARIDKMLEYDKAELEAEFEERRQQLQDENTYISTQAGKLYDELRNLKKGVRASDQLGHLLDSGYEWSAIRAALVNIKHTPGQTVNVNSAVESMAREMLHEGYEDSLSGLDKEYDSKLSQMEQDAEEKRKAARVANQRRTKQQEYATEMEALIGDTSTWVDKKMGISYQTNTLHRNLRDVVRDADGNRDIEKADAIYDALQGSYNRNEAELNRETTRIKQPYADMKITSAEDAYIQMLGELRHNPDTKLTIEEVDDYYEKHKKHIDKAKVDQAIEMARQTYDELLTRVNEVLKEQGMKEIPYRKGYFPHFTEDKQGILAKIFNWKTNNNEIPTDIAGLTEQFNPNRSYQSFNKQRKSDTTDYSFTKGLDSYVHGALDWVYHIEDIQKRRAFENHIRYVHSEKGIQKKIDAIRANKEYDADEAQQQIDLVLKEAWNPLNNFVTDLRTGTNLLAGKKHSMDRAVEGKTNRKAYSVLTNISNRVSANMVGGSISSALTNFIPITQSWGQVSPVSSLKAMGDTIRSTFRDDGMVNKSDFLTNRLRQADNLYKSGWDKVSDKVGFLMEAVDEFTSQTVWRSKYLENINAGMSESEAIKNADQFAENVMAGRSRGNMPTIFEEKNVLSKVMTAFQLEVANQYGYMLKDMPQDMKNEATGKLVMGYAKMFVGAYVYNALYSSLTGRDAAFDPIRIVQELLQDMGLGDDDEEEEPVDTLLNLTENILEEVPFVGGLLGGGRIPISSALPYDGDIQDMISGAAKLIEGDISEVGTEWLNPVYYLALPMGGGQIRKTIQGLSMYSDEFPLPGSYTASGDLRFPAPEDFLSKVQAGVFGQWASENAQDYIDEGRSPLSEKQTQELMDTGMTIQEYWDYRDGLAALNKASESGTASLNEKGDYIASLDLTVEQKNILINNIADRDDPIDMTDYELYPNFEEFDFGTKNPGKYAVAQAVGGYDSYTAYRSALSQFTSDLDEDGNTIKDSRKAKVLQYINSLDAEYGEKIILYVSEYTNEKQTYGHEIIDYLNSRSDISYSQMVMILTELGFTVDAKGKVTW